MPCSNEGSLLLRAAYRLLSASRCWARAQQRLADNKRYAARNSSDPSLLQGICACGSCGYAYYRTSTRTTNKKIYYYRCLGSDDYRAAPPPRKSSTSSTDASSRGDAPPPPGRRREFHPPPPTDPDVNLSVHPARAVQFSGRQ